MPINAKRHIVVDIDSSPASPSAVARTEIEVHGRAINTDITRQGTSVYAERLNSSPLNHREWRNVNEASIEKRKVRGGACSAYNPGFDVLRPKRSGSITAPQAMMEGAS
jgi:hypothetical protein